MEIYKAMRGGTPRNETEKTFGQIVHLIKADRKPIREISLCSLEPRIDGWQTIEGEFNGEICPKCVAKLNHKVGYRQPEERYQLKVHITGTPCGRVRSITPTVTDDESKVTCKTCLKAISYSKETNGRTSPKNRDHYKERAILVNQVARRRRVRENTWKTPSTRATYDRIKRQAVKFPEKAAARRKLCNNTPSIPGLHRHHWSYHLVHALDIIALSRQDHAKLHMYLKYDQQYFMYRRIDTGELLDSKEAHESYANYIFSLDESGLSHMDTFIKYEAKFH